MPDASDAPPSESSPPSLNDQVRDALAQINATIAGTNGAVFQAAAYQTLVHSVTLAMQNAVAEQQQNQILRMALTSAAAKSILAGRKEEAESILDLAKSRLANPELPALLEQVRLLIQTISSDLARARSQSSTEPAPKPPRAAAAPKRQAARKSPSPSSAPTAS